MGGGNLKDVILALYARDKNKAVIPEARKVYSSLKQKQTHSGSTCYFSN